MSTATVRYQGKTYNAEFCYADKNKARIWISRNSLRRRIRGKVSESTINGTRHFVPTDVVNKKIVTNRAASYYNRARMLAPDGEWRTVQFRNRRDPNSVSFFVGKERIAAKIIRGVVTVPGLFS